MRVLNHSLGDYRSSINLRVLGDLLASLILGIVATVTSLNVFRMTFDDMYITYRYAYNLAAGNGFVYNIGEQYLGTTAPLQGFLLGILAIPDPDLVPTLAAVLCMISLIACAIGFYQYSMLVNQRFVGFLAALFFVVNPINMIAFSSELFLQAAFLTWAFVLYKRGSTRTSAVLLALAVLTRADSVLAVGIVVLYDIVTKRRIPWRECAVFMVTLAPAVIAMWIYYGDPLPGTLEAKLAQGKTGLWKPFLADLYTWISGFTIQDPNNVFHITAAPRMTRFIPLIGLGIINLVRYWRAWLIPISWTLCYTCVYSLMEVPFYHWYVVPLMYGLAILAALGVGLIYDLGRWILRHVPLAAFKSQVMEIGLAIVMILALTPGLIEISSYIDRNIGANHPSIIQIAYSDLGTWLKQNTPEDASVGYLEIGFLGYTSQRRIIDPLGLVNEGVSPAVAESDLAWSYRTFRPDYIVHNPIFFQGFLDRFLQEPWFQEEYQELTKLEFHPHSFTLYKRIK